MHSQNCCRPGTHTLSSIPRPIQWARKMLTNLPIAGETQDLATNGKGLSCSPCPRAATAKKFAIPHRIFFLLLLCPEPSQGTEGRGSADRPGKSQQRQLRSRHPGAGFGCRNGTACPNKAEKTAGNSKLGDASSYSKRAFSFPSIRGNAAARFGYSKVITSCLLVSL